MKKRELKALVAAAQRQAAKWEAMYEAAQEKNEELQLINSELNARLRDTRLQMSGVTVSIPGVDVAELRKVYDYEPSFVMLREDDGPDPMERLTND